MNPASLGFILFLAYQKTKNPYLLSMLALKTRFLSKQSNLKFLLHALRRKQLFCFMLFILKTFAIKER